MITNADARARRRRIVSRINSAGETPCLALSTCAWPSVPLASSEGSARIARDDLVVEGRVKTLQYEALDEFGFCGGQMTARWRSTRA